MYKRQGINIKYIDNMQQHQSNVSILITTTGDNNLIKEIAKILKNRNVYTVGILGKKGKDLIQLCHDYLLFDTSLFEDIDSLCATFSAEYVINILYATLLYRLESVSYTHLDVYKRQYSSGSSLSKIGKKPRICSPL